MNSQKGLGPHQAAALQEFASAVRDLLGSRLIALKLFGSQVRGEAASDSDLDVLVAVEEASPALENSRGRCHFRHLLVNFCPGRLPSSSMGCRLDAWGTGSWAPAARPGVSGRIWRGDRV